MTTVTTVEQFEGLAMDTMVSVGGNHNLWTKAESGWTSRGVTLHAHQFEGDILQGRVTIGVKPESGQVWRPGPDSGTDERYRWVLLDEAPDHGTDQWWCVLMHADQFSRVTRVRPAAPQVRLDIEPPSWANMVYTLGRNYRGMQAERDNLRNQLSEQAEEIAQARQGVSVRLAEFKQAITESLHLQVTENPALHGAVDSVLAEHGLTRMPQEVAVTIAARGLKLVEVPADRLSDLIPEADTVTMSQVYVNWTKMVETTVQVEGGACGCLLVSRGKVRDLLVEAGLTDFTDLRHNAQCANHPTTDPF